MNPWENKPGLQFQLESAKKQFNKLKYCTGRGKPLQVSEIMHWECVLVGFPHLLCYPRGSVLLPAWISMFGLKAFGSRSVHRFCLHRPCWWCLIQRALNPTTIVPTPPNACVGSWLGMDMGYWDQSPASGRQEALGDGNLPDGALGAVRIPESQDH